MKKKSMLNLATVAVTASAIFAPAAQAATDNPFGLQKLDSGYQLAQADKKADDKKADDKKKDGKCGEGKCGGTKKPADDKKKDGKCGEGKCGGTKK
jgi:uncharacterized low-complexity protein